MSENLELVLLYAHGRGKGSGIQLGQASRGTQMGANVFAVRDARVRSIACYFDCEHAFADLGIEGQAG